MQNIDFVDLLLLGPHYQNAYFRCNGNMHVSNIKPVSSEYEQDIISIYTQCEELVRNTNVTIFRFTYNELVFRVAAEINTTSNNISFTLRRCLTNRPELKDLKWSPVLVNKLLHPKLKGLVLLTGAMGVGKTFACGALISGRLERYGGYARTLEDPVELPLHGHFDASVHGVCVQSDVPQMPHAYSDAIKKVLREAPDIILIGEARDKDCVADILRAGMIGHLVFSTLHANNVIGALERIRSLSKHAYGDETSAIMAESISAIVHLKSRKEIEMLLLRDEGGRVAAPAQIVAEGKFTQLKSHINHQMNLFMRNTGDFLIGGEER